MRIELKLVLRSAFQYFQKVNPIFFRLQECHVLDWKNSLIESTLGIWGWQATQVAHQRFLCALKAHFEYHNALLMRIKSAGVLPGYSPGLKLGNQHDGHVALEAYHFPTSSLYDHRNDQTKDFILLWSVLLARLLIQGRLERTETNLMHSQWGSEWTVTSFYYYYFQQNDNM